jgi:WD40 repeat protein
VLGAAFSPDGTRIVTIAGNHAKIWNVANGTLQYTLQGHSEKVWNVSFSRDGKRLLDGVVGSRARRCGTWGRVRLSRPLEGDADVTSAAFNQDGSAGGDGGGECGEGLGCAIGQVAV